MHAKASLTPLGQPVPELPVRDVERTQHHYRDRPFEPLFTIEDLDGDRFYVYCA